MAKKQSTAAKQKRSYAIPRSAGLNRAALMQGKGKKARTALS